MAEGLEVAVIGISARFPGAADIDEFWQNLKNGVESLCFYTEEELEEAGVEPTLLADPGFIKSAGGLLENIEYFDASFFNYVPNEALVMDPQVRIFHESAWEALEHAGYNPHAYKGKIGLYAGASSSSAWENLVALSGKIDEVGRFAAASLASSTFLTTRTAYKLNLKGPSFIIQSACSTSLAAIDQACRAILTGQCDMALAGGVSISPLRRKGYIHKKGMNRSADGHCRAFAEKAKGNVAGEGVGVVLLKPLEDAVADKDTIYAVIKGSASNNDGTRKVGYAAPSIEGQAEVIRAALLAAEIEPETITYVETNGTCTPLGDPVEIEALKQGFGTDKKSFCRVGSVKTNIGHLDAAAGVAAFIKVVLALNHRQIPPSLHFETPNPKINFAATPFTVNTTLTPWNNGRYPLRAGVNAFGIGGANVHVVLEEGPGTPSAGRKAPSLESKAQGPGEMQLILLSANTSTALETMKKNLANYLKKNPGINLADAAYTLQTGRKSLPYRWMVISPGTAETIAALTSPAGGETHIIPHGEEHSTIEKPGPGTGLNREALTRLGRLWLHGHEIDWEGFYSRQKRRRVPLPTYPFERQRYWLDESVSTAVHSISTTPVSTANHHYPRPSLSTPYVPPATGTQQVLVETWKILFGYEEIGIRDDFLELGGDSLKAMTIISILHKQLNVEIPVPIFFSNPTVEKLAQYIETSEAAGFTSIPPAEMKEYYALSPAQKRLYVLQQLEKESTAYNETQAMIIEGFTEVEKFQEVFRCMIQRHECYRSPIVMKNAEPVLMVYPAEKVTFNVEYHNFTNGNSRGIGESLPIRVEKTIRDFIRPFDLAKPPFLRAALIKTGLQEHILLVDKHHIVSDGISQQIFIKEAAALLAGQELPALRIQYKDYAQWLNHPRQQIALEKQKTYWLEQFQDHVPVLNLPLDYPRPAVQSFAGAVAKFEIDKKQTIALKNLAAKQGTTLYAVLLAAFNILLAKLSGQEDIVIGTPSAGRRHADLQQLIGMFVNTIALRNYPQNEKSLTGFLQEVKESTLKAFENQDYPFEELVEQLPVNREVSRNPLFDVVFVMQSFITPHREQNNHTLKPYRYERRTAKFDLTLMVVELEEKLLFTCEYCTQLFKPETVTRFSGYFKKILSSIVENPHREISGIEILSVEEKNRLLYDFNQTAADYPRDKTLHELFREQAEKAPHQIALVGIHETHEKHEKTYNMSYKELNEKSTQLAHQLIEKGVQSDTIVGIMLERTLDMIVGILAILKAGGAYMPIDPEYPEERIQYMLKDSGAKILLTREEIVGLSSPEASNICPKGASFHLHLSPAPVTSLAYIIYTSGTTGRPKGSLIEHRNVVRLMVNNRFQFDFSEKDIWTLFHSFCFDFSVWEMYGALLYGGRLMVVPKMVTRDTEKFLQLLKQHQVTVLNQTPSAFYNLVSLELRDTRRELKTRYVIFGGEALAPARLKEWQAAYPQTRLINMYGITETTVHVTFKEITQREIRTNTSNIGLPIPTLTAYLLDSYLNPVPTGAAGELYIGGLGVARGYLNHPELTTEKFLLTSVSSVSSVAKNRIYKTGDLARRLANGELEYLGRIDQQVKIRGFRIELGEIENRLLNHDQIKEALVICKENENNEKYLCAYFVADQVIPVTRLREYLSKGLPDYMIPAYFVQIEKIPLTSNGKVDRRALPKPEIKIVRENYEAPGNDIEEKLIEIWQQTLKINTVGINDNFFEIGGDSIKAIQISARLRQYGLKLEIKDLFLNPTVKQLSKCIKKTKREIPQEPVEGEVPLTPVQHWFFENNPAYYHHYNQAVMLYSKKGYDQKIVDKVFRKIVEHHDALRMVYEVSHETHEKYENREKISLIQRNRSIHENVAGKLLDLEVFDFTAAGDLDIERKIETETQRIQAGIDLQKGPLVKLGLFKTPAGDHLLMVIHHLVIDGVSWRILLEDFASGYQQLQKAQDILLQEKTDSFQYWAQQLKKYAESPEILAEIPYWKQLEEEKITPLPGDFDIPASAEQKKFKHRESVSLRLNSEDTEKLLREVNHAYSTEINDILLAALGMAVNDWCGAQKILVNLEGHGRENIIENIDISRTIGWYTTLFPVLLDINKNRDLAYTIKGVKEMMRDIPQKGIGYGILKYLTPAGKRQGLTFTHQPRISFNYLGQFVRQEDGESDILQRSALSMGNTINPHLEAKFAIDINGIINKKGEFLLGFTYNKHEYRKDTMEKLADAYQENLLKIINHCTQKQEKELTPSDLTYSDFSIEELETLNSKLKDLVDFSN